MKAILVIDKPTECWDCPLHVDGLDDDCEEIKVCNATHRESHYGTPPNWCPLKPMPQKKDTGILEGTILGQVEQFVFEGWNRCIDEILGEEE